MTNSIQTYILTMVLFSFFLASPVRADLLDSCEMQMDAPAKDSAVDSAVEDKPIVWTQTNLEIRELVEENFLYDEHGLEKSYTELQDQMVEVLDPADRGFQVYSVLCDPERYTNDMNIIMGHALQMVFAKSFVISNKLFRFEAIDIEYVHGIGDRMVANGRLIRRATMKSLDEVEETAGLFELVIDRVNAEKSTLLFTITHVRAEETLKNFITPAVMRDIKYNLPLAAQLTNAYPSSE